jgi:O-antigen/teichoic acid export membrane protein
MMFPVIMLKGVLYRLLLPLLSEVSEDRAAFQWRFGRVLTTLALFFMPLSVLAIPVVEWLVVPLFGPEYAGSVLPLQILLGHLFVSGASSIFATAVFSMGYQKSYTWSLTIACAVNLVAAAVLIPRYGAVGGAISVALAELIAPLLNLPVFLKVAKVTVWGRVAKIGFISLAGLITYFGMTRLLVVNALAAYGAEVLVLAVLLWVTGEISAERLRGIVDLVRRNRT